MSLPKLSPLQSRFAMSFLASCVLLVLLYLTLSKPQFAYAAEVAARIPPDHNHPIVFDPFDDDLGDELDDESLDSEFETMNEDELYERAPAGVNSLANNAPQNMNIGEGRTQYWVFTSEEINGPHGEQGIGLPSDDGTDNDDIDGPFKMELKRQSTGQVWISINTCLQPSSNGSNPDAPPQLQLYYSTTPNNTEPGPGLGTQVDVEGGFGLIAVNATDDVYVGVAAPNTSDFSGIWNYEIGASNDGPYHNWVNSSYLYFVDSDDHAALLMTPNFTQADPNQTVYQDWMAFRPPYGMFAHEQQNRSILGVARSYCGLLHNAKVVANLQGIENDNTALITNKGIGGKPKEQIYLNPLDASRTYWGFLAMDGNSTASGNGVIGGGGTVWAAMNFTTKTEANCALLYNLTFCSEVAYAVPSNPKLYSPLTGVPELAAVYDNYAATMYQNFNYSLQQIPCNTTATAQYSLARNCDDCASAYKQWLCAVTIPRCEDYGNDAPYLAPRNMAQKFTNGSTPSWFNDPSPAQAAMMNAIASNSSRNAYIIDQVIQPGPYKEVLPCIDLCHDLVQSCPAALSFGCPRWQYQNMSYGVRSSDSGTISCSWLGAAYYLGGADRIVSVSMGAVFGVAALALSWVM